MVYKMKGTTLYGKPTGKGGSTEGDLKVSRTGNENKDDGRAKSSAFQKKGAYTDHVGRNTGKSTSKRRASKPKVFIDHEKIKTQSKIKNNSEQSNTTVKKTSTKPEKRDVKVENKTLVKGVDY